MKILARHGEFFLWRRWLPFSLMSGLLLAGNLQAEEPSGKSAEPAKPASLTPAVPGPDYKARVRLVYDYREQGSDRDSDFYGYWYGRAYDVASGRADFYVSGRTHSDLDGAPAEGDAYSGLDDAEGVIENRLLQANLDLHDSGKLMRLRLGRQYVDVADYLHLDGGQAILFEDRVFGGRAYYGQPVSYYTSVSGDWAGGFSLVGRPWSGNRARLTFAEYHDDSENGSDRNYFVDVWQEVSDVARTRAQVSVLNDEFRMARLDFSCFASDGSADAHVGCSRWGEFDARTRMYSPLYQALGPQEPYTYAYARVAYEMHPSLMVSPGVAFRFADRGGNDYANRDYSDYDLTFSFEPRRSAFSSSVSVKYWDIENGDDFVGLSGDVRYRRGRVWEVSGGAEYVQYTYQSYSDISYSVNDGQTVISEDGTVAEETPYSIAYFLRTKWNVTRHLALKLQGDVEDSEVSPDLALRIRGTVEVRL
jgi:hypothetical protein